MPPIKTFDDQQACPCGSALTFDVCCKPLLDGQPALSAEQLMRSRYSAFYLGHADYLSQTTHASYRNAEQQDNLSALQTQEWLSLQVLNTEKGTAKDAKGVVEFIAYYQHDHHHHHHDGACESVHQLHERSYFVKEKNLWYYTQGDALKPIKIGRNDLCWCGSKKKFKQCHGAN